MPPADPWAFGSNQLLTLLGMAITLGIAGFGFRSFEKWKREKIEERRIDLALEALALAYETQFVFDSIRSPGSFESEWAEMKGIDDPDRRRAAGPFYATLSRIDSNKDFFQRCWRLQPRFMAMFGKSEAQIFAELHRARRLIEVSASMLMREAATQDYYKDEKFRAQLEADIWGANPGIEQVNPKIATFVSGIEKLCAPIVKTKYRVK
jgi:hypothetical protein